MKSHTIKILKNKKLVALVVAATVFSSVYAFAATLGVSANSLGAGNASVTSCTASVTSSYAVAYDSTISGGGYRISGVTVTGISGCSGKSITADLVGSGNASLVSLPAHTITAGEATANTYSWTVGGSVNAANVTGVSAVVAG
jgi:hypothetical protein